MNPSGQGVGAAPLLPLQYKRLHSVVHATGIEWDVLVHLLRVVDYDRLHDLLAYWNNGVAIHLHIHPVIGQALTVGLDGQSPAKPL